MVAEINVKKTFGLRVSGRHHKNIALAPHLLVNESIQSAFILVLSSALQIRVCWKYLARKNTIFSSVGVPDPQDPHVFGPSGSISQRCGSGSFPFLIHVLRRLK
jgi:hypothetical protein